jgi:hypothetical protein
MKKRILVSLPEDVHRKFRLLAVGEGLTNSQLVERLVTAVDSRPTPAVPDTTPAVPQQLELFATQPNWTEDKVRELVAELPQLDGAEVTVTTTPNGIVVMLSDTSEPFHGAMYIPDYWTRDEVLVALRTRAYTFKRDQLKAKGVDEDAAVTQAVEYSQPWSVVDAVDVDELVAFGSARVEGDKLVSTVASKAYGTETLLNAVTTGELPDPVDRPIGTVLGAVPVVAPSSGSQEDRTREPESDPVIPTLEPEKAPEQPSEAELDDIFGDLT